MNKKKLLLTEAIKKFRGIKDPSPYDYMDLIIICNRVLKPANGLSWTEVLAAIKDSIYGEGNWGSYKDTGPHWSDKPSCDKSSYPG